LGEFANDFSALEVALGGYGSSINENQVARLAFRSIDVSKPKQPVAEIFRFVLVDFTAKSVSF